MKYVVGVDEVGRGPLAGPVTVCAVICEAKKYARMKKLKSLPASGKDSKKLTSYKREYYSRELLRLAALGTFSYSIVHVSNKIIDSKGISHSIRYAIEKNLLDLGVDAKASILLDGGLKAPHVYKKQTTIIKGDEKEKIIAWASILAKVSRDSLMKKAAKKFPQYGFDVHKGYGTKDHRQSIKNLGLSPFHRKSFCKQIVR